MSNATGTLVSRFLRRISNMPRYISLLERWDSNPTVFLMYRSYSPAPLRPRSRSPLLRTHLDLNQGNRFCRPVPNHSTICPYAITLIIPRVIFYVHPRVGFEPINIINRRSTRTDYIDALPGFEPGSPESKSGAFSQLCYRAIHGMQER